MSIELKLLALCCKFNFRRSTAGPLARPADLDWQRFWRLAAFHRVEGLAWGALASSADAGASCADLRSAGAKNIAALNLLYIAECKELLARFQAGNIPVLFLKGLTLGALSYRNHFLKSAIDADILIDRANLDAASSFVRAAGYRLILPRRVPLNTWHKRSKESVWAKQSLQLDLHTRAADNPVLIKSVDVHSPTQIVPVVTGLELPTLATDELVAYLAVHGASSCWFRLKWIADFAGLLDGCSAEEVERLYLRSQELGAGRAAGQALLLADNLFATLGSCGDLREELLGDGPTRRLYRLALRLLTREPVEPTDSPLGTLPIHYAQLLLKPDLTFKRLELAGQLRGFLWGARQ